LGTELVASSFKEAILFSVRAWQNQIPRRHQDRNEAPGSLVPAIPG
jgi:hypothetical protein